MSGSLFGSAFDAMNAIDSGDEFEDLNVDQRLKLAEVKALLTISQELSKIRQDGINPKFTA
ncbi:hypothetical protein [Rhodococcus sp. NPDC060176]|uniref:hypothetical protein n=1 Tax=Rhodococcus sp. NPDC060176 TaxID=3347062 RepID=UPI003663BB66